MVIKGKTEELLVEVQAKGMRNIFNKIITENFPNLKIYSHTDAKGPQNTKQIRQNRTTPRHIIIKTTNTETRKEY
jgi:hypothetical protein